MLLKIKIHRFQVNRRHMERAMFSSGGQELALIVERLPTLWIDAMKRIAASGLDEESRGLLHLSEANVLQ